MRSTLFALLALSIAVPINAAKRLDVKVIVSKLEEVQYTNNTPQRTFTHLNCLPDGSRCESATSTEAAIREERKAVAAILAVRLPDGRFAELVCAPWRKNHRVRNCEAPAADAVVRATFSGKNATIEWQIPVGIDGKKWIKESYEVNEVYGGSWGR